MAKRTKAPKVDISGMRRRDRRTEMLQTLDGENKDFVHVFRNPNVSPEEMALYGYEWVRRDTYNKESGDDSRVTWRRDAVARIPRETYEGMEKQLGEESYDMVKEMYCSDTSSDEMGRTVGNLEAQDNAPGRKIAKPKNPSNINKNGEM
jgi:hypothetical protein